MIHTKDNMAKETAVRDYPGFLARLYSGAIIKMAKVLLALAAAFAFDAGAPAALQAQEKPLSDYDHMRGRLFVSNESQGAYQSVPATLHTRALASAKNLLTLLRRDQAVVSPIGYSLLMALGVEDLEDFRNHNGWATGSNGTPLKVTYGISGVLLFGQEAQTGDGEGPRLEFDVNDADCALTQEREAPQDEHGPIFQLKTVVGENHGYKHYGDPGRSCILITREDRPLFLPVSKGDYLRAVILQAKKDYEKMVADTRRELAKYQQTDEPEETEADKALLSAIPPADAARVRKSIEEGRKQAKEMAAEMQGVMQAQLENSQDWEVTKRLKGAQKMLADLPANVQREPAYPVYGYDDALGIITVFLEPDDPKAHPVVRYNPEYFNRADPLKPQTITVTMGFGGVPHSADGIRAEAFARILDGLDWAAIKSMIAR